MAAVLRKDLSQGPCLVRLMGETFELLTKKQIEKTNMKRTLFSLVAGISVTAFLLPGNALMALPVADENPVITKIE